MKLLDGKTAVIYGAAGVIGSAVAKAFAKEGVKVILAGRTLNTLESLAGKDLPDRRIRRGRTS